MDLGIPAPDAESPRAFAARLVEVHGVDADDIGLVRDALEHAIYAEDDARSGDATVLAAAVDRVRARLRTGTSAVRRALAVVLPRSLTMREQSATVEVRERVG